MAATSQRDSENRDIRTLLASRNASDNSVGLGLLLEKDAPVGEFADRVMALEGSAAGSAANLTVGEVASMVLHIHGLKEYQGGNPLVLTYINQLS